MIWYLARDALTGQLMIKKKNSSEICYYVDKKSVQSLLFIMIYLTKQISFI